jgi:hypothetical protein
MSKLSLSIVVVSMNRNDHLRETLRYNGKLESVSGITILDFGSTPPTDIHDLTFSYPVITIRINHKNTWSLARAYNLAIALTRSDYILKTDADMFISQRLIDLAMETLSPSVFITGNPFFKSGPLISSKQAIELAGFFNEDLIGWGYEEIDLYSRLRGIGLNQIIAPHTEFEFLDHTDKLRTQASPMISKEYTNLANCVTSLFRDALTTKEQIISLLNLTSAQPHKIEYEDSWSDKKSLELSRRLIRRIQEEALDVQPKWILPLALEIIREQRSFYNNAPNL